MLKTNFQNDVKYQTAPKWPRKLQMINQCSHPPDGFFGASWSADSTLLNLSIHVTFLHQKGQAVPDPQTCRIISWHYDTLYLFHTNKTDTHKNFFSHKTNKKLSLFLSPHCLPFPLPFHPPTRWHFAILAFCFFWFEHKLSLHLGICLRPAVSMWSSEKLPIRNKETWVWF